jgi:hypothetical protein
MMQGYEKSKLKVGDRPVVEEEREIYLPDEYRMGGAGRSPVMIRAFDPDAEGSMMGYMQYKKGGLHKAANQVRNAGRHDDTMLIHVNPEEFKKMREMFGDPIINPETGIPEYGFFSKLKKAFKKIAPILSVAGMFIPGLNVVGGLAKGLTGLGIKSAGLANTLAGAAVGGVTGGKRGAITGGLGGFASTADAAQNLGAMVPGVNNPTLQTAVGRGLAGAGGAALTGGDPLAGGLSAAVTGYGADKIAGSNFVQQGLQGSPLLQQAALGATQGLNIAGQTGGDLGRGALAGAVLGGAEQMRQQYQNAGDAALEQFRTKSYGLNQPETPVTGFTPAPTYGGPAGQTSNMFVNSLPQSSINTGQIISNISARPEVGAAISQLSAVPTKDQAIQAAMPLAANPDTRPVYDAMSNFRMCDNAPHFGACFAQNFGTFMSSISQNAPRMQAPMGAKTGGLARFAMGGQATMPRELAVGGPGDGQDDHIPALLSDGEFIIPADVVSALGSGSTDAGSDALYEMIHNVRRSYRSADIKDIPAKAKSPLMHMRKK